MDAELGGVAGVKVAAGIRKRDSGLVLERVERISLPIKVIRHIMLADIGSIGREVHIRAAAAAAVNLLV